MDKIMRCICGKRKILIFMFFYLLISVCLIYFSVRVNTPRNLDHEEIVRLDSDEKYVRQKLYLSDTDEIQFTIAGNYGGGNCQAEAVIEAEEELTAKQIEKRMALTDLPNHEWHEVTFSDPALKEMKGDVTITIRVESGDENNNLDLLLIDAKQKSLFPVYIGLDVSGETHSGQYIFVSYQYFDARLVCVCLIIVFLFLMIAAFLSSRIQYKQAGRWIKNNFLIVFGATVLIWTLLETGVLKMEANPWSYVIYLMNYEYGFVSQAFPGTIIKLVFDYFSEETYKKISVLMMAAVFAIESVCFFWGKANKTRDSRILGLIYIMSPGFLTSFCNLGMFGKTDVIVLGCYLLCFAVIIWERNLFLIPIFALAGAMTHEQFLFEYFPFLFLVMAYMAYVEKKKAYGKYVWITTGICGIFSISMRFFGHLHVTLEELVQQTQARTDMKILEDEFKYQYFTSPQEVLKFVKDCAFDNNYFIYILTGAVIGFPLIYYVCHILHLFAQQSVTSKERMLVNLLRLSPLLPVASCIIAIDWGRYILAYYNAVYLMIMLGVRKGNEKMCDSVRQTNEKMRAWIGEYWLLLAVVYFMICGPGMFGAGSLYDKFNPFVYRLMEMIETGIRGILYR